MLHDRCDVGQYAQQCNNCLESPSSPSNLSQESDRCLLNLLLHGNEQKKQEAFTAIWEKYHLDVHRFIRSRITQDDDVVDDIFGQVWKKAVDKLPKFTDKEKAPDTPTPIKTWLFSASRLICFEYFKQNKDIPLDEDIEAPGLDDSRLYVRVDEKMFPDASSSAEEPIWLLDKYLRDAFLTLSPIDQEILKLKYLEEKNSTEIGNILDMNPTNIRKRLQKALEKIRQKYPKKIGVK